MHKLTEAELATVLAALRVYQRVGPDADEMEIATNEGRCRALDAAQIDDLCERLNFGSEMSDEPRRALVF